MKDVLIYGCGEYGKLALGPLQTEYNYHVLAFIDQKPGGEWNGIKIDSIECIKNYDYDLIIICLDDYQTVNEVSETLADIGVNTYKIKTLTYDPYYIEVFKNQRSEFMKDTALYMQNLQLEGSVAECGVYRGDSAKFLNRYFCDKKLFLFDTFEGFNEADLNIEKEKIGEGFYADYFVRELFTNTSMQIISAKMTNKDNIIYKKGYFPKSAEGVDERFCFVNLDMDLYTPMLAGLQFFYDRMVTNGIILLHDYFHPGLNGVKQAVEDFEQAAGIKLMKFPIGDHCSIAVMKTK